MIFDPMYAGLPQDGRAPIDSLASLPLPSSLPLPLPLPPLGALRDDQLTTRLYELRTPERLLLVEFLHYLGEVDRRKLYAEMAYSSLYAFCTEHLGLSGSAAYRRATACRLMVRFPVLAGYLADGRLSLSSVVALRHVLSEDRLDEILARASGCSETQVRALVAALQPRQAPPDRCGPVRPRSSPGTAAPAVAGEAAARSEERGSLEPISEDLFVLRITVGKDFVRDLQRVRDALSHQVPRGRLEDVLHHCMRATLELCDRRRRGTGRPSRRMSTAVGRYVLAAVRDEVWRRDESRCAYVARDGRRCNSTYMLQLHHVIPIAKGGRSDVPNLSLRCAMHNRYHAERDFGAQRIAAAIAAQGP